MTRYSKAIVATLVLLGVIGQALVDGSISPTEWGQIGTAAMGAAAVWRVPNRRP